MKLYKFYNNSCGPCKIIAPLIDSYKHKIEIISVDTHDEGNSEILRFHNIRTVPTIVIDFGEKTVTLRGTSEITKRKLDELIQSRR